MRTGRKLSPEILGSMVGAALLTAILAVGALRAAELTGPFGPGLGDIVDFRPGITVAPDPADRIGARIDNGQGDACVLDIADMAAGGGSLIVEAREQELYLVHWAGARTSNGSGDCGAARNLLINRPDLDQLAAAAGGFGVPGKRIATSANYTASHCRKGLSGLPGPR